MKLSVIIIAKNEEKLIQDCLDSVSFANEIIVVDDGSTDNTVSLVEKVKNSHVIKTDAKSFSKKREEGLKTAQGEWIFYIDADERVTKTLKNDIEKITSLSPEKYAAYNIQRKNFYLGNYEWSGFELLPRLFVKRKLQGWIGELHETPVVNGQIGVLNGFLIHYSHRDITSMLGKTIGWSKTEARLRYDFHHPKMVWWRFFRVMVSSFLNSYIVQGGWRVGTAGLIESIYQSFSMFITYARLWELQQGFDKKSYEDI